MIVNVSEAKTNLSKLIDLAFHGEKIVIAKNNTPLVDLVVHKPSAKRKLGLYSGQATLSDDFNDEDEDINNMFYGQD